MNQQIKKYLNLSLFNLVDKFRLSYVLNQDIDENNVGNITEYIESTDTEVTPDTSATSYFYSPEGPRYNVVWGLTNSGQLVFLSEIKINLQYISVNKLKLIVNLVESDLEVDFGIDGDLAYTNHTHQVSEVPTQINKFTSFSNELTDDNVMFSKGKILNVNSPQINQGELKIGPDLLSLDSLSHVYNVNFLFEANPDQIVSKITDTNFDIFNPNCNLTYRGSTVCYKNKLGKYIIIKGQVTQVFNSPVTLITELLAINHDGRVLQFSDNTWTNTEVYLNVVIYRSGYKLTRSGNLIKVI